MLPKARTPVRVGKRLAGCQEESLLLHQPRDLVQGAAQNLTSLALMDI